LLVVLHASAPTVYHSLSLHDALPISLRADGPTSFLVTTGTAICGGSAIAAMAPVVEADERQTGVSLATVFTLNAVALVVFPPLGDRKSTRLNSSHVKISYAVFCLKKK